MSLDNTTRSSLAEYIELGHKLGWSFTPLNGKVPTLKKWQDRDRETLEQALAWAAKGNVGIRTGSNSGIVVIDVDPGGDAGPLNLPATATVRTGRDGLHFYYRCHVPVRNSAGKLGKHIDVKADRGQVVFPGSIHPDTGQRYEWFTDFEPWNVEIADLPADIIERLAGQERPKRETAAEQSQAKVSRYVKQAIDLECEAIAKASEGQRNDTLNRASFNLGTLIGGGYVERSVIEDALTAAAEQAGLSTSEITATLRSGLDAGVAEPRYVQLRPSQNDQPVTAPEVEPSPAPKYSRRDDTTILTPGAHKTDSEDYIEQTSDAFTGKIIERLPDSAIYRKDCMPGEVLGEPGKRRWVDFTDNQMVLVIDRHCRLAKWVTHRKKETQVQVYQPCTKQNAALTIAAARQRPGIRDLNLMVTYPVYGPDWKRIQPGWHDGLFYDQPPELAGIEAESDCEVIHNVLYELVVDFPFKSEADRHNFFGLLLTPLIAPAIDGNRPMHMLLSPLERTGKTKLVEEVFGGVIIGKQTPAMQITARDEERDKRILSLLLSGETMLHLDNLPPYIDSATLASLLTATTYRGRMLGSNRVVSLPNNLTVVSSGNNVQASGEIIKRSVPIILQPATANPENRCDFQHRDLRGYVRENRRLILSCLLGLIENWIGAGKPMHASTMGGFEDWSGAIGGILRVNAFKEWRANEKEWREAANPKGTELENFVESWHEKFKENEVTAKELMLLAGENDLFLDVLSKPTPQAQGSSFGRMLGRYVDAPIGNWIIRREKRGKAIYRLEPIS